VSRLIKIKKKGRRRRRREEEVEDLFSQSCFDVGAVAASVLKRVEGEEENFI
jgi:hypothetical protein